MQQVFARAAAFYYLGTILTSSIHEKSEGLGLSRPGSRLQIFGSALLTLFTTYTIRNYSEAQEAILHPTQFHDYVIRPKSILSIINFMQATEYYYLLFVLSVLVVENSHLPSSYYITIII